MKTNENFTRCEYKFKLDRVAKYIHWIVCKDFSEPHTLSFHKSSLEPINRIHLSSKIYTTL